MSAHSDFDYSGTTEGASSNAEHYAGIPTVHEEPPAGDVNLHLDIEIEREHYGGGDGKGKEKKKKHGLSIEERARELAGQAQRERPPVQPQYPPPAIYTNPTAMRPVNTQPVPPSQPQPMDMTPPSPVDTRVSIGGQIFDVDNTYIHPGPSTSTAGSNDPWVAAGSLKPLEAEEVIIRRAGSLSDILNAYIVISYIMLTNRRIVIKQRSSLFGVNLYTVESSFLYENLRHVTVQRITNFRFLWAGVIAFLVGLFFLIFAAVSWIYAVIGVIFVLASIVLIYWFLIFYNANSVVIDFSKDDLVGSWTVPRGKGAFTSKSLILHISHCFDIMYLLYDQARSVFAQNND